MPEPVLCECGTVLVASVDAEGVTTVDGDYVVFKRRTDYVACENCLRSYPVIDLLPKGPRPVESVERIESMLDQTNSEDESR